MRVLVLHSDVSADAAPDDLDTLVTAQAVTDVLAARGHQVVQRAFVPEPGRLADLVAAAQAETVFNLVESVHGDGMQSAIVPAMLEKLDIPYTGARAAALALAADKVLSKRVMRAAGLPTADWAAPPGWDELEPERRYVVKSVTEDASLGLDDDAVVSGADVPARAELSKRTYGGRWFAEAYLEGREFNVALLQDAHELRVLPIPEMRFEAWDEARPRIVGYAAKWSEDSADAANTVRSFAVSGDEPALAADLAALALRVWPLFGLRGYARIDFRLDDQGAPMILEVNPNPCLEPNAGFAAAAAEAGMSYPYLIEHVLRGGKDDC